MSGVAPAYQTDDNCDRRFIRVWKKHAEVNGEIDRLPAPLRRKTALTRGDIRLLYTTSQATAWAAPVPPIVVPVRPVPAALGAVKRPRPIPSLADEPDSSDDEGDDEAEFLAQHEGPRNYKGVTNWSGVRILGSGSGGIVAMFEWVGAVGTTPTQDRVAVKSCKKAKYNLEDEGKWMTRVGESGSEHVVRLLRSGRRLTLGQRNYLQLDNTWTDVVRQLIMEYCPNGTLFDLFAERRRRNLRFEELTLWHIFECLIDGCSVLEYGSELKYDDLKKESREPPTFDDDVDKTVVVHRDLKLENVFVGQPSSSHTTVPVIKMGDFGSCQEWQRNFEDNTTLWRHSTYVDNHNRKPFERFKGTMGYHPPETFHPGWNYNDYQVSPVCGRYNSHTNIWQVGAMMYELACFTKGRPEAKLPYTPAHPIHGAPAKGRLYGTWLQTQPALSNLLKDTIFECLYELPANRATLLKLKTTIRTQIDVMILDPAVQPEEMQDLVYLEPITAAQSLLPKYVTTNKQCTALTTPGVLASRCQNKLDVRNDDPHPRCHAHYKLKDWPRL